MTWNNFRDSEQFLDIYYGQSLLLNSCEYPIIDPGGRPVTPTMMVTEV